MTVLFEIHGGLPEPLAKGALEMFFSQNGNGGTVGFSTAGSRRHVVAIGNGDVARRFRTHMEQLRVRFQQLSAVPHGVELETVTVPSNAQLDEILRRHIESLEHLFGLR